MTEEQQSQQLERLLEYIKRSRGFDFTGYKRASLRRRISKRMQVVGIDDCGNYLDYLEAQPQEFTSLFNTILINVTRFFRDRESWDYLAGEIVPNILRHKAPGEPIRVWCPGAASGQEAYSAAMLLAEGMGEGAFRERVKVYGTDVDEEALNQARQAVYSEKEMEGLDQALRDKYFESANSHFAVGKDIRRCVIFGRHDLLQDPPISRIDLLICRNTLMYFNAEAQGRILARLHFALSGSGFLFLGRSETLLAHSNLMTPADVRHRVFRKAGRAQPKGLVHTSPQESQGDSLGQNGNLQRLSELALEGSPAAQIVVDLSGTLVAANERARDMLGVSRVDLGRPIQEMEIAYRPVDLRGLIESAHSSSRPVGLLSVEWRRPTGEVYYLDVQVMPLLAGEEGLLGSHIAFLDVTRAHQLMEENLRARQELENYSEELQSANEELETTNEELQSTNEELETTNEELQSANEELETMNEELQSTNEELEAINRELHERTYELNRVQAFRDSVLTSMEVGVAVLDRELRVQVWNRWAEDVWGLRDEEVRGQHFLNLDIGLPVEKLKGQIRDCLAGQADGVSSVQGAVDRRGRTIECRVKCTPLVVGSEIEGAVVLMETRNVAQAPG